MTDNHWYGLKIRWEIAKHLFAPISRIYIASFGVWPCNLPKWLIPDHHLHPVQRPPQYKIFLLNPQVSNILCTASVPYLISTRLGMVSASSLSSKNLQDHVYSICLAFLLQKDLWHINLALIFCPFAAFLCFCRAILLQQSGHLDFKSFMALFAVFIICIFLSSKISSGKQMWFSSRFW